jgi:hypothetical protein
LYTWVYFQEALELSFLKPELDTLGVKLYAVVHQTLGVEEFKDFFKGEVFLDDQVSFSSTSLFAGLYNFTCTKAFLLG